jgi:hypothetical protein
LDTVARVRDAAAGNDFECWQDHDPRFLDITMRLAHGRGDVHQNQCKRDWKWVLHNPRIIAYIKKFRGNANGDLRRCACHAGLAVDCSPAANAEGGLHSDGGAPGVYLGLILLGVAMMVVLCDHCVEAPSCGSAMIDLARREFGRCPK